MKPANPPTYSRYSLGRRRFLALVSGGLVVAPVAAHAQQPALPVIGLLGTSTAAAWAGYVAGFRQGLSEAGYVDGRNLFGRPSGDRGHHKHWSTRADEVAMKGDR